jgi:hypothetical protein
MSIPASRPPTAAPVITALLPIMAVVLIAFLIIGLALPVLPLHVHQGLGLGAFVVGLVAGRPVCRVAHLAGVGGALFRQAGRQARSRHRPFGSRGVRTAVPSVAELR